MAAQTNYEDNSVFLSAHLKLLRTAIHSDIDSDLFLNKLLQDITFHSETLNKLYAVLAQNSFLIQRAELLRLIMLNKRDFIAFLDEIKNSSSLLANELLSSKSQFDSYATQHLEDIRAIMAILSQGGNGSLAESDMVSANEYKFLFQPYTE